MRHVVDTNVPVVANGRNTNASTVCRIAAIEFLEELLRRGRIVLDLGGHIQEEYERHLFPIGQPGVGDRFYQEVLLSSLNRVERVELRQDHDSGEYLDFPNDPQLQNFDPSDRKFAAASRKSGAPVANAVDSDWLNFEAALAANGINIRFICGRDRRTW